mmetsp:Transcript_50432/g.45200  ORF Transcript_50432/g.45200 Transcript_50432/m.45200 type:complete len:186 (-) Transcript_50432:191-748(-)
MAEYMVDWSLKHTSLRKELLALHKTKLIKLCKHNKVSTNGSKRDMANLLIMKHKKTEKNSNNEDNENKIVSSRRKSIASYNNQNNQNEQVRNKDEGKNKKVSFDNEDNGEDDYSTEMDEDQIQRKKWKVGSRVELYSLSSQKWEKGKIKKIFNDKEGEWLVIKYAGFNTKEIQRYNLYIRPIQVN